MRLFFVALVLLSCVYIPCIYAPCVFAQDECTMPPSSAKNNVVQENVLLSLPAHGRIGEEILLHIDIPQDAMPTNAWGRVAVKSSVTLEDGTMQKGQVKVLEGVPETTMHFTQKGLYELTISVGYLVKST